MSVLFWFVYIRKSDSNYLTRGVSPDGIGGGENEQAAGSVLIKDDGSLLPLGHGGEVVLSVISYKHRIYQLQHLASLHSD